MEVVLFYIFIAVCAVIAYKNRRKSDVGVITMDSGAKYPYVIGNYLVSETSSFNGLEVTLPYSLTNFYLDSHKDSRRRGPAALYDKSQMISLEGNFDKYFQLFAPANSSTLVLSILSPDVMQTLIGASKRYDVELSGQQLRIITLDKTSNLVSEPLLKAAKAIITELDHRALSWKQNNIPNTKLTYRRGVTLKLVGIYLRRSRLIISILVIILTTFLIGLGFALYYTQQDPTFSDPYSKGLFPGTMMYAAYVILITSTIILILSPFIWLYMRRPNKSILFL